MLAFFNPELNFFHKTLQQEPTVGHRANVAEWRQRRHFAAFALSCIAVNYLHT